MSFWMFNKTSESTGRYAADLLGLSDDLWKEKDEVCNVSASKAEWCEPAHPLDPFGMNWLQ